MFTRSDLIEYSNWVTEWCLKNKYRKTIDGAKPYGLGEPKTDNDLFDIWLSIKPTQPLIETEFKGGVYGC